MCICVKADSVAMPHSTAKRVEINMTPTVEEYDLVEPSEDSDCTMELEASACLPGMVSDNAVDHRSAEQLVSDWEERRNNRLQQRQNRQAEQQTCHLEWQQRLYGNNLPKEETKKSIRQAIRTRH